MTYELSGIEKKYYIGIDCATNTNEYTILSYDGINYVNLSLSKNDIDWLKITEDIKKNYFDALVIPPKYFGIKENE